MKEYMKKNYKVLIILLIIIIIGTIGLTLANEIISANIALGTGEYNVIYTGNATLPTTALEPVYDSAITNSSNASKVMKVEFTVKGAASNPTNIPIIYDVSLTNLNIPAELQNRLLKWKLFKNGTEISNGSFSKDFDSMGNNRMVLTEIQQDLPSYSETADSYAFYIWISEECTGDITSCTPEMNTAPLMGKTFSGEIRIELSTKAKKQLIRFTGDAGATLVHLGLDSSYIEGTPDFSKVSPSVGTYKELESAVKTYNLDTTRSQYYVTYGSTYVFDKINGTYSIENANIAQYASIYQSLVGKYITNYTLSSSTTMESVTNRGTIYKITDASYDSTAKTGVIKYIALTEEIASYSTSDSGIFKSEDDLGTSYYFRGNVTNNYVKFADSYWRIIRINGDGTVRMIYDGTTAHANGDISEDRYITTYKFNNSNNNAYVGYMYGSTDATTYNGAHDNINNSTIKTYLEDTWYENNIAETQYEEYIADAIYCNDRTIDTGTGIGTTNTRYMAYKRLVTNKSPALKCNQVNDRFTKNEVIGTVQGNGDLKYSVGLITADEVILAGGGWGALNTKYYLYNGKNYWTMTPYRYTNVNNEYASTFNIYPEGSLSYMGSANNLGVKPVISLKADAINSGSGTMTDPFEIGNKSSSSPAEATLTYLRSLGFNGTVSETEPTTLLTGATTDEGLFAKEDDQGTSYYFRGAVTNNYVKFGKYTEDAYAIYDRTTGTSSYANSCGDASTSNCTQIASSNDDMYWRIIRINGDGSIRMIYDGTSPHANGTSSTNRQIGESKFNYNTDDNAYVGYMYGQVNASTYEDTHANTNDSSIKTTIDRWYSKYLNTNYGGHIINAIYCNDRKVVTDDSKYKIIFRDDTKVAGTGIGGTTEGESPDLAETLYGIWNRMSVSANFEYEITEVNPSLKCEQLNDRFTMQGKTITTIDELGGNQNLIYPVGLITADEVILAGGADDNYNYYLYTGNWYWTGSAFQYSFARLEGWEIIEGGSQIYFVNSYGYLSPNSSDYIKETRPVISINVAEIKYGTGEANSPFRIEE